MTIPDFQTLMRPVLAYVSDGSTDRSRVVKDAMAEQFGLTEAERAQMLPSGRQRTMDNPVGWARTDLVQAGFAARPNRGHLLITEEGRAALAHHQDSIDLNAACRADNAVGEEAS